jgi:hypothetical protein
VSQMATCCHYQDDKNEKSVGRVSRSRTSPILSQRPAMKFFAHSSLGTRPRASHLAFLVPGLLLIGCVSLDKPAVVKTCASSPQGCSDNPVPTGGDAAIANDAPQSEDLPPGNDTLVAHADLPPAIPDLRANADLATDPLADVTGLTDTADGSVGSSGKDATEVGIGDVSSSELANPDLPGPDLPGPDLLGSDVPGPDLLGPDLPGPDLLGPDLLGPDLPGPDLPADLPTGRDSPTDIIPDLGRDQAKTDTGPGNCINQIIASGYAAGTAPPCSACNDGNGNSLTTKCTGMLDCLAPPKTSADFTNCLNAVAGSSKVGDCVTALTTAGCPGGY